MRMTLAEQDRLTALSRFLGDCWGALPPDRRDHGIERIKASFDGAPGGDQDGRWTYVVRVVTEEVGADKAESFLADYKPYFA